MKPTPTLLFPATCTVVLLAPTLSAIHVSTMPLPMAGAASIAGAGSAAGEGFICPPSTFSSEWPSPAQSWCGWTRSRQRSDYIYSLANIARYERCMTTSLALSLIHKSWRIHCQLLLISVESSKSDLTQYRRSCDGTKSQGIFLICTSFFSFSSFCI